MLPVSCWSVTAVRVAGSMFELSYCIPTVTTAAWAGLAAAGAIVATGLAASVGFAAGAACPDGGRVAAGLPSDGFGPAVGEAGIGWAHPARNTIAAARASCLIPRITICSSLQHARRLHVAWNSVANPGAPPAVAYPDGRGMDGATMLKDKLVGTRGGRRGRRGQEAPGDPVPRPASGRRDRPDAGDDQDQERECPA